MHIALTTYLYPIEGVIPLSPELGLTIANPQTEEERDRVYRYLSRSYGADHDIAPPPYSEDGIVTVESVFERLAEALEETDATGLRKLPVFEREFPVEGVAEMAVLVRWDSTDAEIEVSRDLAERRAQGERVLAIWGDDAPEIVHKQNIESYCHLLGLLVIPEPQDFGTTLLAATEDELMPMHPPSRYWMNFMTLAHFAYTWPDSREDGRWQFFPAIRDHLLDEAGVLDQALQSERRERLLYVGHLLHQASGARRDSRSQILFLTSVLELLLTHSPNFDRFNVDDSISKQFVLKAALLAYLADRQVSLEKAKQELRTIYRQRSNIVHGNFETLSKWIASEKGSSDYPLEGLVSALYGYVRTAVRAYLTEPALVEFLKEG